MSYEYEIKDIINTMIDNNEPHWSVDTMDMVKSELNQVYAQAAKAEIYEKLPEDILQTIRTLQAEMPRTKDHLIAIGTYQTILNHLKSYGLGAGSDE